MSISFLTSPSSLTPKSALLTFLLLSCVKWLLVPSYRSTDFDVHRNWLALTRHVPVKDWYYDDVNGTTVHTLDYPPLFAFFEYALSNNVITSKMLEHGWLDVRCLESIPDASSNDPPPSEACVKFHRGTVIFVGDVIFFVGAYLATNSMSSLGEDGCERASSYFTFASLVSNPGIVMLDHVHFQYNGMLLGVLLISISCMVRGGAWGSLSSLSSSSSSSSSSKLHTNNGRRWELLSAATFAGLLATKHLFLTLAPLYFFYLLGRHCFIIVGAEEKTKGNIIGIDKYKDGEGAIAVVLRFSWSRLLVLAAVSLLCLFGPFVPFLIQPDPMGQMRQILKRLFPFGRGVRYLICQLIFISSRIFPARFISSTVYPIFPPSVFSFHRNSLPAGP
jgi:alpha-1,3-glucosyltransferase